MFRRFPWTPAAAAALTALSLFGASSLGAQTPTGTVPADRLAHREAVDLRIQWGRLVVRPSMDDALHYRVVRDVSGPVEDSLRRLPEAVPYRVTQSAGTWFLSIEPEDAEGFVGAVVEVDIPSSIRRLHLAMERGGAIDAEDFDGELEIVNRNGDVHLRRLGGATSVTALNGEIRAGFHATAPDAPITLLARNGGLSLDLPSATGGSFHVETRSGAIRSTLPLEIEELPGDVRSQQYRPRRARLLLTADGPHVRLMTLNGDIDLRVREGGSPGGPQTP